VYLYHEINTFDEDSCNAVHKFLIGAHASVDRKMLDRDPKLLNSRPLLLIAGFYYPRNSKRGQLENWWRPFSVGRVVGIGSRVLDGDCAKHRSPLSFVHKDLDGS